MLAFATAGVPTGLLFARTQALGLDDSDGWTVAPHSPACSSPRLQENNCTSLCSFAGPSSDRQYSSRSVQVRYSASTLNCRIIEMELETRLELSFCNGFSAYRVSFEMFIQQKSLPLARQGSLSGSKKFYGSVSHA